MSAILNVCVFHDGTPSNINYHVLRKLCAKCGAVIRPVTIISRHLTIQYSLRYLSGRLHYYTYSPQLSLVIAEKVVKQVRRCTSGEKRILPTTCLFYQRNTKLTATCHGISSCRPSTCTHTSPFSLGHFGLAMKLV